MYDFSALTTAQLLKELRYQRQFAGVPGVPYYREYCQLVCSTIRGRVCIH